MGMAIHGPQHTDMDERLLNDPEFLQEAVGVLKRDIVTLKQQLKEIHIITDRHHGPSYETWSSMKPKDVSRIWHIIHAGGKARWKAEC